MKITVLMENTAADETLYAEHGLSFLIETDAHVILFDTGASDLTWENADLLDVDLSAVDTVVLSHGHYDHTGGLLGFTGINEDAKIYVQKGAFGSFYHQDAYIGMDEQIASLPNLCALSGDYEIDDELFLFSGITGRVMWPKGNAELLKKEGMQLVQDDFSHEQCLVVDDNGKKILFSGCAHNGIINIMNRYNSIFHDYPDAVFSGFHMMKNGDYSPEEAENIERTARELLKAPTQYFTGHCTGDRAFNVMKEIMGEQLEHFHAGDLITCR